jgi:hypothetical protein
MFLVCRGRCRIEFPVAHLDPPRGDMTLHRDADMVWAIAGTCSVKFLSGFAGGQGKNALALASARRVHVPPTWLWLLLAVARGLAG